MDKRISVKVLADNFLVKPRIQRNSNVLEKEIGKPVCGSSNEGIRLEGFFFLINKSRMKKSELILEVESNTHYNYEVSVYNSELHFYNKLQRFNIFEKVSEFNWNIDDIVSGTYYFEISNDYHEYVFKVILV